MAQRGKTSAAENLIDWVTTLPCWVGVTLALVSYLVLSSLAAHPIQVAEGGGSVGGAEQ